MTSLNLRTDTAAHHSMAVVGGFFGVYALFTRSETFGSSETTNLIYLILSGLNRSYLSFFIRLGAMLFYIAGIIFATIGPKYLRRHDFRYVSVGVDLAACLVLSLIPAEANPVMALYPMFFATAVQWLSFTSAAGFNSATIFSTNNLRQCFAGLSEYLYCREQKHLDRFLFYGGTLICFHVGVIYGWGCLRLWGSQSILACLLPLGAGAWLTHRDVKASLGR